ncbi:PREDICTED: flavonoid [Prunus dulcis]|uniref:PREDICTED: flavonoid n=1 Tax=Prunus dulcis TaxID=3755 RepID=A0A5E4GIQ1_PRUDU|nr:PREDICTED: flavonoid [Prunus dulcis]
MFLNVMNVIMNMLWGGTVKGDERAGLGAEFREVVSEITELLGKPNVSNFYPGLAWFNLQGVEKQMGRLAWRFDGIFEKIIDKQMRNDKDGPKESKDFLTFLLKLKDEGGDSKTPFTITHLKALLMDLLTGGSDTTTTMMEWVMTELMQNPEEMRKVQEELTEIVGLNNLVEEFHLPKLHYLDAVIKETFRLHPALPLLVPHRVTPSTTLGGYTIPKGSSVFLNIWANHRDSSVWESPLEFRPQRFINDPSKFNYKGSRPEFLPFGSGRRRCVGMPLGERMLIHVLASFLHLFEWRLPHGAKPDFLESFGVVTRKLNQLVVIPTPRLSTLELYP